jgi:hypothetical protein
MARWSFIIAALAMLSAGNAFSQSPEDDSVTPKITEQDLNEDGKVDRRNSVYQLDPDLTLTIYERLDYKTDELIARLHSLKLGKKELWWEIFVFPTQTRSISCPAEAPLSVSLEMKGDEITLVAVFDKTHLVAALKKDEAGKLLPASQEELRRYREMGMAATEFVKGIFDQADSENSDKTK